MAKSNLVQKVLITVLVLLGSQVFSASAAASGITIPDPGVGLKPITIPTFLSLDQIANFSVLSYFSFLLAIAFLGVMLLWVVLVVRAAIDYLRSQGDEKMIEGSTKRISNVFASVTILFVFIVVITVVANFFGIGNFWEWPKSFSLCNGNLSRDPGAYYFNYFLRRVSEGASSEQIDRECFR